MNERGFNLGKAVGHRPEIKEEVLATLQLDGHGRGKVVIRIVTWNGRPPVLEKRQIVTEADGSEFIGKARGFRKGEFEQLMAKKDEIMSVFNEYERKQRAGQRR